MFWLVLSSTENVYSSGHSLNVFMIVNNDWFSTIFGILYAHQAEISVPRVPCTKREDNSDSDALKSTWCVLVHSSRRWRTVWGGGRAPRKDTFLPTCPPGTPTTAACQTRASLCPTRRGEGAGWEEAGTTEGVTINSTVSSGTDIVLF